MSKTVDKAILKVAYILSSLSGLEKNENKKVFREICKEFSWFAPGDPDTDKFVLDIMETAKTLASLRQFYDEGGYYTAFLSKLKGECETVRKDSKATVRKAFVIWISICLADNDGLSDAERKTLKALQAYLNFGDFSAKKSSLIHSAAAGITAFSVLGTISPGIIGPTKGLPEVATGLGILGSIFGSNKKTPAGAVNLEAEDEKAIVSDRFVEEAIETVTLLGELAAEMEATPDREAKASMKESFELLQKELQSKIMAD